VPDGDALLPHDVRPWTVGELRQVIRDLPDHLPVWANVAEVPGGASAVRQAVVGAGFRWERYGDGTRSVVAELEIECEFPAGGPVSP
jgi:hypothetical protein